MISKYTEFLVRIGVKTKDPKLFVMVTPGKCGLA
jgi:hypothetical protein